MGLGYIIIVLERHIWGIIKIIRDVEGEDIFIRMELYMMAIGRMGIRRELVVMSMEMAFIWGSVIWDLDMEREFICLRMGLVMRGIG